MPLSGTIRPAGAPRSAIPGADAAPVFRGEVAPQPGAGAAPDAAPEQSSIEILREAAAAATAARKAAAAETAVRAKDREAALRAREQRVDAIDQRLRTWRNRPDVALSDLGQYGVTFEQLAQTIAAGGEVTPDQLAAAEAAQARAEVAELRRGLEQREQREAQDRVASQREAQVRAKSEFTSELIETAAASGRHPLLAHFGAKAGDVVWQEAERQAAAIGGIPEAEGVLDAVEESLAAEIEGAMSARSGRRPAPRGAANAGERGAGESEAERRARFLSRLSEILGAVR